MEQFDPTRKLARDNIDSLPVLCTDGAWGTLMLELGAEPGEVYERWNVEQPDNVLQVAKAYVDAGAQIILTNTFNSNRIMLSKFGLEDRAAEFAKAGAALSKQAANGRAYVFGSIGPCGKMVMMGEKSPEAVEAAAAEQAEAMVEGGADAIVVETQSDLMEAEAALRGCLKACDVPVGVTFTFDAGEHNDYTMMGVSIPQAYETALNVGASFTGANCGAGIETFVHIAQQFHDCGNALPIWVKGNAGMPEIDAHGNTVYKAPPEAFAKVVPELVQAGARFIGGCCGTSPEHVRAMVSALQLPR